MASTEPLRAAFPDTFLLKVTEERAWALAWSLPFGAKLVEYDLPDDWPIQELGPDWPWEMRVTEIPACTMLLNDPFVVGRRCGKPAERAIAWTDDTWQYMCSGQHVEPTPTCLQVPVLLHDAPRREWTLPEGFWLIPPTPGARNWRADELR